jgi:hypothetical protein
MKKQRWEEPTKRKEEEIRTETTGRRSKIQVREKVEKSRNTVFFHGFVGGTTTWQGGCGRESVAVVDGGGRAVVGRPWYPYHPEHRIWVTILQSINFLLCILVLV